MHQNSFSFHILQMYVHSDWCVLNFMCALFSVLGAVIVIIGMYMLLWGKEGDQEVHNNSQEQPCLTCKQQKDNKILIITSADKEVSQCEP
jgi:hypothetical protein